ncbi:hypothetical protein AMECASPLE_025844, partial [Ameca splendens]
KPGSWAHVSFGCTVSPVPCLAPQGKVAFSGEIKEHDPHSAAGFVQMTAGLLKQVGQQESL